MSGVKLISFSGRGSSFIFYLLTVSLIGNPYSMPFYCFLVLFFHQYFLKYTDFLKRIIFKMQFSPSEPKHCVLPNLLASKGVLLKSGSFPLKESRVITLYYYPDYFMKMIFRELKMITMVNSYKSFFCQGRGRNCTNLYMTLTSSQILQNQRIKLIHIPFFNHNTYINKNYAEYHKNQKQFFCSTNLI